MAEWPANLAAEARRALVVHDGYGLPPAGWELVGERAWGAPSFQREAAALLEAALRRRFLFVGSRWETLSFPTLSLSPRTVWLLAALAAAAAPAAAPAWAARHNAADDAAGMLAALGRRHGLVAGWAGFWDQWLLLQATRRWPTQDKSITRPILALPLAGQPDSALVALAAPNWAAGRPDWFILSPTKPFSPAASGE